MLMFGKYSLKSVTLAGVAAKLLIIKTTPTIENAKINTSSLFFCKFDLMLDLDFCFFIT